MANIAGLARFCGCPDAERCLESRDAPLDLRKGDDAGPSCAGYFILA